MPGDESNFSVWPRVTKWACIVAALTPFLYVIGLGPVEGLYSRGFVNFQVVAQYYRPADWFLDRLPDRVAGELMLVLGDYTEWWRVEP